MSKTYNILGKHGNQINLVPGTDYKVEFQGKIKNATFIALGQSGVHGELDSYCFQFKRAVKTSWGRAMYTFVPKEGTERIVEQVV